MNHEDETVYSRTWNSYVEEGFPKIRSSIPHSQSQLKSWQVLNQVDSSYEWPGDEWGDDASVREILKRCLFDKLGEPVESLCELGSGAGRFSKEVLLRYPDARLFMFDVSASFIASLRKRLSATFEEGRFQAYLLDADPRFIYQTLTQEGLRGRVNALYSFDAMVHVELHTIAIYIATAAATLRPGGIIAMNVADATNNHGFQKMLFNAPGVYAQGGEAGMQFQFVSPDIVKLLLDRFGFSCELLDCNGRDIFLVGQLQDPHAARLQFATASSGWWF